MEERMNIIIAGGSGLIGQAFITSVQSHGHQVWVLTRNPDQVRLPEGAKAIGWDGKTGQGWGHLVETTDAIVNLAGENIGEMPWTKERKARIRSSRVLVGQALADAVLASTRRPRVLMQASGVGYYGTHTDEPLTEQAGAGSDYIASVAVDWENATQAVEALGVRRIITRSGIVLTPKGGALSRFLWAWRAYLAGPMGSGKQWYSWIHMHDQVEAMRFLLENEAASGVYNLTTPEPVTNETFGRTLAKVMGRPFWLPVPAFGLRLLLGEMSTVVLDGQRALPERLQALGYRFAFPTLKLAFEDLLQVPG
jgi:uncharacterized protein